MHPSEVGLQASEEWAATDPRLWYLLFLILSKLGAFAQARTVYRQALGRLPMAYFGHVVHFNLACLHATEQQDAAPVADRARAAAWRELLECRRHCRSFQQPVKQGLGTHACDLCGAPCVM